MDRLYRDVGKGLNRRESSNDRRVFGPKAHSSVPKARGVWGHAPPGNFENAYSGRCIFLVLRAKSRAFRTAFYQVTGNKVTMNWSVDC